MSAEECGDAMNRTVKIALGLATVWPLVYMFVFFAFVLGMLFSIQQHAAPANGGMPPSFIGLFALHFLTMLWVIALTGFYIVHVVRNERIPKDQKVLWVLVVFLGGFIGMPVYW